MSRVTEFEQALMHRDGDTREEARKHRQEARDMFYAMMDEGAGYDDIEDMMACEYGLEMDYIFDIM